MPVERAGHQTRQRGLDPGILAMLRENKQMRYDVRCGAAPWENTTTDLDKAIDLAYSLSEDYQCDVNIHYNHTGTIYTTVSNY